MGFVDFTRRDYPAALRTYKEFQKLCQEILDEVKVGPKPLKIQDHAGKKLLQHRLHVPRARGCPAVTRGLKKAEEYWSKLAELASLGHELPDESWDGLLVDGLGRVPSRDVTPTRSFLWTMPWTIFDRLIKAEPDNLDYQIEKASALNLKGAIYDDERQNDLARATFKEVVQLRRSILERSRGIDDHKVDLCMSLENLGETYVDRGDVAEGLLLYREALGLQAGAECGSPGRSGVCNGRRR